MAGNDFETVILTGGASRRMGFDKSSLEFNGQRLIDRLISDINRINSSITILGRSPEPGVNFLADAVEFSGPLASLRNFIPAQRFVFVLSCDIVHFSSRVACRFREIIGDSDAVMANIGEFDQPLCALYSEKSFEVLRNTPDLVRMKDWGEILNVKRVGENDLQSLDLSKIMFAGANTPEEFQKLLSTESL